MRPADVLLALLVVVLWGVNFVVIKLGLRGVSPFVLAALRFVVATLPALPFVPRPRVPLRLLVGFALATLLGQFALLFSAMKLGMPSGLASLVLQSQVLFTTALAMVVLGERPRPVQLAGMAIAAGGLAWIGASGAASFPLVGFALTLAAALSWAIGNLVSRGLARHGPVSGLSFVVWAGLLPPLPFLAMARLLEGPGAVTASLRAMRPSSWAAVAYLAFGATLGGYGLWSRLLRTYPAAQVARFTLLVPVVGLAAGALVLGERLTAGQLAASALVIAGLALPVAAQRWTRGGRAAG